MGREREREGEEGKERETLVSVEEVDVMRMKRKDPKVMSSAANPYGKWNISRRDHITEIEIYNGHKTLTKLGVLFSRSSGN